MSCATALVHQHRELLVCCIFICLSFIFSALSLSSDDWARTDKLQYGLFYFHWKDSDASHLIQDTADFSQKHGWFSGASAMCALALVAQLLVLIMTLLHRCVRSLQVSHNACRFICAFAVISTVCLGVSLLLMGVTWGDANRWLGSSVSPSTGFWFALCASLLSLASTIAAALYLKNFKRLLQY